MAKRYFKVNEDSTCSLNYEGLHPQEMFELAELLRSNAMFIINGCKMSPIEIMKKTCQRKNGELSFRLSYITLPLAVDLSCPTCPAPNVTLDEAQSLEYVNLYNQMVGAK